MAFLTKIKKTLDISQHPGKMKDTLLLAFDNGKYNHFFSKTICSTPII